MLGLVIGRQCLLRTHWFNTAETLRMRDQLAVLNSGSKSTCTLQESLRYLLECEQMLTKVPACSASPESLHTCLVGAAAAVEHCLWKIASQTSSCENARPSEESIA